MATDHYAVQVLVEHTDTGEDWEYQVLVNHRRIMAGERRTRSGAQRAGISQLKQLQRDIDQALKNLK